MSKEQPPITYTQPVVYGDEISLLDIIGILLRRKRIIMVITVLVVSVGLVYALSQSRVYQVETILLPPSFEHIQQLNVLKSDNVKSDNVKSDNVFKTFIATTNSRKFKQKFFNEFNIVDDLISYPNQRLTIKDKNDIFEAFSKSIKHSSTTDGAKITLEGNNDKKIGQWLDSFVTLANRETIKLLVGNLKATINSQVASLKIRISSKRTVYKQRREDQLESLKEDYQIAKSLNITEHLFVPRVENTSKYATSTVLNGISNRLSNENNLSSYMKGTKVLQAEISALKNRKSDDFKITGLRDLQEKLTRLESIKINDDNLQSVIVDKKASIDVMPIRPNRKLIAIYSLILGGILGILVVLMLEFIDYYKNRNDVVDVA